MGEELALKKERKENVEEMREGVEAEAVRQSGKSKREKRVNKNFACEL